MNYNKIYNSWKNYTKSARQLLLEAESTVNINLNPEDYLRLTTTQEDMARIQQQPSISAEYDPLKAGALSLSINLDSNGTGKVRDHEGRNRAFKAMEAGLKEVPVQILVLNRKASINDINKLEGQFNASEVVDRSKFKERELKVDNIDPLGIGESKSIKGYDIQVGWEFEGIKGYIRNRYVKEPAFQKEGRVAFVNNILNKYYSVKDDTGQEYKFANSADFKVNNETGELMRTGLLSFNLEPNPLTLTKPASMENINMRTYTIYKR